MEAQKLLDGSLAAAIARGFAGRSRKECTPELAATLLEEQKMKLTEGELQRAKQIVLKIVDEVLAKDESREAVEAWAARVEGQENPFETPAKAEQKTNDDDSGNVTNVATKAQLQAAVKTLGMGYIDGELQARILAFIEKSSGEKHKALPTPEELAELKKAAEAKKELSFLDASSIIEGRPKRRAASSAAEAIKRDIARDLEREAAQAASEPQQKKAKVEKEAGTRASAAPAAGSGAGKRDTGLAYRTSVSYGVLWVEAPFMGRQSAIEARLFGTMTLGKVHLVRIALTCAAVVVLISVCAGLTAYFLKGGNSESTWKSFGEHGELCTALGHLSTDPQRRRCKFPLICMVQSAHDEQGICALPGTVRSGESCAASTFACRRGLFCSNTSQLCVAPPKGLADPCDPAENNPCGLLTCAAVNASRENNPQGTSPGHSNPPTLSQALGKPQHEGRVAALPSPTPAARHLQTSQSGGPFQVSPSALQSPRYICTLPEGLEGDPCWGPFQCLEGCGACVQGICRSFLPEVPPSRHSRDALTATGEENAHSAAAAAARGGPENGALPQRQLALEHQQRPPQEQRRRQWESKAHRSDLAAWKESAMELLHALRDAEASAAASEDQQDPFGIPLKEEALTELRLEVMSPEAALGAGMAEAPIEALSLKHGAAEKRPLVAANAVTYCLPSGEGAPVGAPWAASLCIPQYPSPPGSVGASSRRRKCGARCKAAWKRAAGYTYDYSSKTFRAPVAEGPQGTSALLKQRGEPHLSGMLKFQQAPPGIVLSGTAVEASRPLVSSGGVVHSGTSGKISPAAEQAAPQRHTPWPQPFQPHPQLALERQPDTAHASLQQQQQWQTAQETMPDAQQVRLQQAPTPTNPTQLLREGAGREAPWQTHPRNQAEAAPRGANPQQHRRGEEDTMMPPHQQKEKTTADEALQLLEDDAPGWQEGLSDFTQGHYPPSAEELLLESTSDLSKAADSSGGAAAHPAEVAALLQATPQPTKEELPLAQTQHLQQKERSDEAVAYPQPPSSSLHGLDQAASKPWPSHKQQHASEALQLAQEEEGGADEGMGFEWRDTRDRKFPTDMSASGSIGGQPAETQALSAFQSDEEDKTLPEGEALQRSISAGTPLEPTPFRVGAGLIPADFMEAPAREAVAPAEAPASAHADLADTPTGNRGSGSSFATSTSEEAAATADGGTPVVRDTALVVPSAAAHAPGSAGGGEAGVENETKTVPTAQQGLLPVAHGEDDNAWKEAAAPTEAPPFTRVAADATPASEGVADAASAAQPPAAAFAPAVDTDLHPMSTAAADESSGFLDALGEFAEGIEWRERMHHSDVRVSGGASTQGISLAAAAPEEGASQAATELVSRVAEAAAAHQISSPAASSRAAREPLEIAPPPLPQHPPSRAATAAAPPGSLEHEALLSGFTQDFEAANAGLASAAGTGAARGAAAVATEADLGEAGSTDVAARAAGITADTRSDIAGLTGATSSSLPEGSSHSGATPRPVRRRGRLPDRGEASREKADGEGHLKEEGAGQGEEWVAWEEMPWGTDEEDVEWVVEEDNADTPRSNSAPDAAPSDSSARSLVGAALLSGEWVQHAKALPRAGEAFASSEDRSSTVLIGPAVPPLHVCVPWSRPVVLGVDPAPDPTPSSQAAPQQQQALLRLSCEPLEGQPCTHDAECWGFAVPLGYCDPSDSRCKAPAYPTCLPLLQKLVSLQIEAFSRSVEALRRQSPHQRSQQEQQEHKSIEVMVQQQAHAFLFASFPQATDFYAGSARGVKGSPFEALSGEARFLAALRRQKLDQETEVLQAALLCCIKFHEGKQWQDGKKAQMQSHGLLLQMMDLGELADSSVTTTGRQLHPSHGEARHPTLPTKGPRAAEDLRKGALRLQCDATALEGLLTSIREEFRVSYHPALPQRASAPTQMALSNAQRQQDFLQQHPEGQHDFRSAAASAGVHPQGIGETVPAAATEPSQKQRQAELQAAGANGLPSGVLFTGHPRTDAEIQQHAARRTAPALGDELDAAEEDAATQQPSAAAEKRREDRQSSGQLDEEISWPWDAVSAAEGASDASDARGRPPQAPRTATAARSAAATDPVSGRSRLSTEQRQEAARDGGATQEMQRRAGQGSQRYQDAARQPQQQQSRGPTTAGSQGARGSARGAAPGTTSPYTTQGRQQQTAGSRLDHRPQQQQLLLLQQQQLNPQRPPQQRYTSAGAPVIYSAAAAEPAAGWPYTWTLAPFSGGPAIQSLGVSDSSQEDAHAPFKTSETHTAASARRLAESSAPASFVALLLRVKAPTNKVQQEWQFFKTGLLTVIRQQLAWRIPQESLDVHLPRLTMQKDTVSAVVTASSTAAAGADAAASRMVVCSLAEALMARPVHAFLQAWDVQGPVQIYGGPSLDTCSRGGTERDALQWGHLLIAPQLSASEQAFLSAFHDVWLRMHSKGQALQRQSGAVQALEQWLVQLQLHQHHQGEQHAEVHSLLSEILSLLGAAEARSLLEESTREGAKVEFIEVLDVYVEGPYLVLSLLGSPSLKKEMYGQLEKTEVAFASPQKDIEALLPPHSLLSYLVPNEEKDELEAAGLTMGEYLSAACEDACFIEETGRMDTAEVAVFSFVAVPHAGVTAEALEKALLRMVQLAVFTESPVYRLLPYGSVVPDSLPVIRTSNDLLTSRSQPPAVVLMRQKATGRMKPSYEGHQCNEGLAMETDCEAKEDDD
ncbi:lwamide related protein [Cyclospora cayetanensis]|uniref:Lwamide related protein n=1 Tax=Cyclospora cayetanensis TaxID=88456 RepID=A0A1D3CZ84_9EIME|nr:lwamide related protein [Cyclospora cayetanensis]